MKTKADLRAKDIERAMKLVWSSLASHLNYTHSKHFDGKPFHKRAVKEYAEILHLLSKLF